MAEKINRAETEQMLEWLLRMNHMADEVKTFSPEAVALTFHHATKGFIKMMINPELFTPTIVALAQIDTNSEPIVVGENLQMIDADDLPDF